MKKSELIKKITLFLEEDAIDKLGYLYSEDWVAEKIVGIVEHVGKDSVAWEKED
jgi:hypothetical protein